MEQVHMIGIDLAKHGFRLHGAGPDGSVAIPKKSTRGKVSGLLASQPSCQIAMKRAQASTTGTVRSASPATK